MFKSDLPNGSPAMTQQFADLKRSVEEINVGDRIVATVGIEQHNYRRLTGTVANVHVNPNGDVSPLIEFDPRPLAEALDTAVYIEDRRNHHVIRPDGESRRFRFVSIEFENCEHLNPMVKDFVGASGIAKRRAEIWIDEPGEGDNYDPCGIIAFFAVGSDRCLPVLHGTVESMMID